MTDNYNYNGWTNWETWNFNLWVTDGMDVSDFEDTKSLTDFLEDLYEEIRPELNSSFFDDLIDVSKHRINFREIAENLLGD